MYMSTSRAIDWDTAQRIGELIAGSPPYGGPPPRSVQPLAHEFARRVGEYTGLSLPDELPPLEMIDRPAWIAANLLTMRPLLDPLLERLGAGDEDTDDERRSAAGEPGTSGAGPGGGGDAGGVGGLLSGPLRSASGPLRSASGHLLGAQLGMVTGMLSQRVLGQYDVSLLDASAPPRLLLLAPNLAAAARNLGVDRDELIAWVAIHEITHAVQISGACSGSCSTVCRSQRPEDPRPGTTLSPGCAIPALCSTGRGMASCERCSIAPVTANCCGSGWVTSAGGSSSACRRRCR
jgi:putative hydrolase